MRATLCVVSVLLAALPTAPAETQTPAPSIIQNPDWLKRPTPENMLTLYPREAAKKGVDGRAVISCTVTVQGTLRACKVESEDPPGLGFGAAALALTPQFLMKPATRDGVPFEGTVRLPIAWKGWGAFRGSLTTSKRSLVYSNLPFNEAPTLAQVASAYPEKARKAKVGGVVSLKCEIKPEGRLASCDTVREEPKGYGFASAAKSLVPLFAVPDKDPQGESLVTAKTMMTVAFDPATIEQGRPVIGRPKWVSIPQVNNFAAVMPEKAKAAKAYKASVVMNCSVAAGGRVEDCSTVSEDPVGMDWGAAAQKLTPFFRLSVWTEEGLPTVGGRIRIPLRFEVPPPAPETPKSGG